MKKLILISLLIGLSISIYSQRYPSGLTGSQVRTVLDTLSLDVDYTVRKAKGRYLTINSAISAATAGSVILVKPGTYDEAVSVGKQVTLILEQGAIISYSGANTTAAVTITANADIYGGQIIRSGSTAGATFLSTTGATVNFYGTKFKSNLATLNFYWLKTNTGTVLKMYNVDFDGTYATTSGSRKYYNYGGTSDILNESKVEINGSSFCGLLTIRNTAEIILNTKNWFMNASQGGNNNFYNYAKASLSVKEKAGRVLQYGNSLDSLTIIQPTNLYNQAQLNVLDGIWNTYTYFSDSSSCRFEGAFCYAGNPYLQGYDNTNTDIKWKLNNCNLRYEPFDWSGATFYSGVHMFEANASGGDTCIVNLEITNSYLSFGDRKAVETGSTNRILGNIWQTGWKGKLVIDNSVIVDWGDDNQTGYKMNCSLPPAIDIYITNNTFTQWGNEDGFYLGASATDAINLVMVNNTFNMLNVTASKAAIFFDGSTSMTNITAKDYLRLSDNTVIGKNKKFLSINTYGTDVTGKNWNVWNLAIHNNTTKSESAFDNVSVYNKLFSKGYGFRTDDQLTVLQSDGICLTGTDVLAASGSDGDSLTIRLYYKNYPHTASGTWASNRMDVSMTIETHRSAASTYTKVYGLVDVRYTEGSPSYNDVRGRMLSVEPVVEYRRYISPTDISGSGTLATINNFSDNRFSGYGDGSLRAQGSTTAGYNTQNGAVNGVSATQIQYACTGTGTPTVPPVIEKVTPLWNTSAITFEAKDTTDPYEYVDLLLKNNNAFAIEVCIFVKQSLNLLKIETIRK